MTSIEQCLSKVISPEIVRKMTYPEASGQLMDSNKKYLVYPNVIDPVDSRTFKDYGIRHDILVIHPSTSEGKLPSTKGVYLPLKSAKQSYRQLFQVLSGEAIFVLQTQPKSEIDVRLVDAKEGDIVDIPSGYGYTIINRGTEDLVISSLVKSDITLDTRTMQLMKGSIYEFRRDESKIIFTMNPAYIDTTVTTEFDTQEVGTPEAHITGSIYEGFVYYPEEFDFLK